MNNIMNMINTKKILYTLSGLTLLLLFSLFMQNYVYATPKEGKKYGNWVVACEKNNKQKTCFLSLTLSNTNKNAKQAQFVANFKLGYFGKEKKLQMIQILPFGISLPSGTTLAANKKAVAQGVFTTCEAFGCIAVANLKNSDITILEKDQGAFIGVFASNGKQINFPISTKGLKEGLEALKQ